MAGRVHRDALSAWKGLAKIGGIEPAGRDEDFSLQIKEELDPKAENLEVALRNTSMGLFLNAFFQAAQPFALIFQDILKFFEKAGAHEGREEWRLSVGDAMADLKHFEEYLEHWSAVECEIDVPALDRSSAFTMNSVRFELGGADYLRERNRNRPIATGFLDVDEWLAAHDSGEYAPYPLSLHPDTFDRGLDDAARIVMAALSVIQAQGLGREEMLSQHRARRYASVKRDAFHPWTIAQNETDFWLRSSIVYLARLRAKPRTEREKFGSALAEAFAAYPRRKLNAVVEVKDLERLLSLPAWKKRYEFYGVWVATEIIGALEGHGVTLHHDDGKLEFAFKETKIADVTTARPRVALFGERKAPLSNPIGKSRKENVQPDYTLWVPGAGAGSCPLVVEVKHYKKRSRGNFRSALVDYARAHSKAEVALVNYGPVGKRFSDLPQSVENRCHMIGYMNPQVRASQESFRKLVRGQVGEPVLPAKSGASAARAEAVVVDVSASMEGILKSDWFDSFLEDSEGTDPIFYLVDKGVRTIQGRETVRDWLSENPLGASTALAGPIGELLERYERVILVTDRDGARALGGLRTVVRDVPGAEERGARLLEISSLES